ncbi:MAG: ABC transporter permease subunit, partial [Bacteroidales bacterium]|nr:ABC transporter permease subunit [Bacteroidales bacterium]
MKLSITKTQIISVVSVMVMLVVWKLLALHYDSEFILPHPEKTLLTTLRLFGDGKFIAIIGTTIFRGIIGFAVSFILGVGIGIWAGLSTPFNAFLKPILVTIRSIPVIALILLALIWFHAGAVPVFIAMLTMFPFICTNVIDGIGSIDRDLVEMAVYYKTGRKRIIQ